MVVGHFATALLPHSKYPQFPVFIFLICANLADFLWLILALFGIEYPFPVSMWDVTFQHMEVPVMYSHELVPTLALAGIVTLLVYLVYRQKGPALACGALVLLHLVCDLLSGLEHYTHGPGSFCISLNLYGKTPHLAIVIEAVFGAICVFIYEVMEHKQGRPLSLGKVFWLYLFFTVGALVWLQTATVSLKEWFSF